MFERLKLKSKMLLGYAVPVVVYVGIAGLVYSTVNKVFDAFEEVDKAQTIILETNTMALGAQGTIRSFRGYLINKNEDFAREYDMNLKSSLEAAQSVKELIAQNEQKERIEKMLALINEYDEYAKKTMRIMNQGQQNQAIASFNAGNGKKFVDQFDRLLNEFEKVQRQMLEEKTTQARDSLRFLLSALIVGSFLLIILAVTIALTISSGISNAIERAVSAIASSSVQIAATVTQQERTSSQQASSVHQTTTTMDELGASSRHAAEQAESSAENARQLLKMAESSAVGSHQVLSLAGEGTKSVEQTLEGIFLLKEKVGAISEQIMRLNQQTNQIGSITNLVTDLANQTNMLALNAAVEAVRAGEHGKGFGVVAAEIRKLADQSKKSAEKINNIISEIQSGINLTVKVTDEGQKKADEGIKLSQGTADAFTSVSQAINDMILNNQQTSLVAINQVVESCQQISLTAKQQAIAIQQVVEAMTAINQGASETASGISQTKIGTQKMNEAALALKAIV